MLFQYVVELFIDINEDNNLYVVAVVDVIVADGVLILVHQLFPVFVFYEPSENKNIPSGF